MNNKELLDALSSGKFTPTEEAKILQSISYEALLQHLEKKTIAWKIWTEDDVKTVLSENNYPCTENNIALVSNALDTDYLKDCQEGEWDAFYLALKAVSDELERDNM